MTLPFADDLSALRAVARDENAGGRTGLCTIVNINGSFSRRLGAQLAVLPDGSVAGSLADGCLERELASEMARGTEPRVLRYGAGSPKIDFRLPCGGGLDILIDPAPDRAAAREALALIEARGEARLALPAVSPLATRRYVPQLRLVLFGEGPELAAMAHVGTQAGLAVETHSRDEGSLALGSRPEHLVADRWTAIALLFHDHEWERAILEWALATPAFFIGAQGGAPARAAREAALVAAGFDPRQVARIASPIGTVLHSREPAGLALSVLAAIAGEYELRHPHHHGR
ncbi:XdhC family protein [Erythrobacter arachoides]|uniref:XdhC family protein n=1 Tax=Aurantiacibacter arachoides TaxID=1850444 RepID=A0A845A323_9SPHN|nr:XdhC family protein [Aurantiacibacter arachoides]MXO93822.1 XdhC family protein [Aurantiacibacter arachoides]GGD46417.1 lipoprotein [Aurantiacibacter arachoides]